MPTVPEAFSAALEHHRAGRLTEAEKLCRAILQAAPEHTGCLHLLGVTAIQRGEHDAAVGWLSRAIQIDAQIAEFHHHLGLALAAQWQHEKAAESLRRALVLDPRHLAAHLQLGRTLRALGQLDAAADAFRAAAALDPHDRSALLNLGATYYAQEKLQEAKACFQRLVDLDPCYAPGWNNLAAIHLEQGEVEAAVRNYDRAVDLDPNYSQAYSNRLMCEQYRSSVTPDNLLALSRGWDDRYAPHPPPVLPSARRQKNEAIRIGFVSPDLHRSPVGYFLAGLLRHLDGDQARTIVYSDSAHEDDLTADMKKRAALWRNTCGQSDEQLLTQIRADDLDILFDLAGHTHGNRLPVFARRGAPIQVTWAGYVGTTGLAAMDFLLADYLQVPEGVEAFYRERVLRMPRGYVCYAPPEYAPEVGPLPSERNGHITFAAFHNAGKIGPLSVELWARVLHELPTARLILKYKKLTEQTVRARLVSLFERAGISQDRLTIEGTSPHRAMLARYNDVDITLDSRPYSGGLTTLESLWMGVPVITLPGLTFAGRHALSHLTNAGVPELVARNEDDFVQVAVDLAQDGARLAHLRRGLRVRMAESPLCDARLFAADFLALMMSIFDARGDAGGFPSRPTTPPTPAMLTQVRAHLQEDRLADAERVCRSILAADPSEAEAYRFLGLAALARGQHREAQGFFQQAIDRNLISALAYDNLAIAQKRQGRLAEAEAACRRAVELAPNLAQVVLNLGTVLSAQSRFKEAEQAFRRALSLQPKLEIAENNLGNVLFAQARASEAIEAYRRALDLRPTYAEAAYNLGNVFKAQGLLDDAIESYRRALHVRPVYPAAADHLAIALHERGNSDEALRVLEHALALTPNDAPLWNNLATTLHTLRRYAEAEAALRKALSLQPTYGEAAYNLGLVLQSQSRFSEAVAVYQRAIELCPTMAVAHNNLAVTLKAQGFVDEAMERFATALRIKPDYADAHSNLLYTAQFRSGVTLAGLAKLHADWNARHAASLKKHWRPFGNEKSPGRRLRLGFVSADFRRHPVAFFLLPVLESLRPQECETFCYFLGSHKDELTARIATAAGAWREVHRLNDDALAEQIRTDEIDILFDLAGHTDGGRLLLFAHKPAPVQITWLGYVGTTGLEAIDYLLADRFHVLPAMEPHFREKVVRMPDGYVCYDPPADAPDVGPLPASTEGHATFGCFSNLAKITPQVIAVWADILNQVPTAQLFLKYRGLESETARTRIQDLFSHHGVAANRLDLEGQSPQSELLSAYGRVDIGLDPFPYSGGLTTCEALWMGVPVITCPGGTFASRHSFSHLSNIGLTETIARDLTHYVELAVELANDWPRLARWRIELRNRMAQSPLCDAQRFADGFLSLLKRISPKSLGLQP